MVNWGGSWGYPINQWMVFLHGNSVFFMGLSQIYTSIFHGAFPAGHVSSYVRPQGVSLFSYMNTYLVPFPLMQSFLGVSMSRPLVISWPTTPYDNSMLFHVVSTFPTIEFL